MVTGDIRIILKPANGVDISLQLRILITMDSSCNETLSILILTASYHQYNEAGATASIWQWHFQIDFLDWRCLYFDQRKLLKSFPMTDKSLFTLHLQYYGCEWPGTPYWHELTLILTWISNHIHYKVGDELTCQFPNCNGSDSFHT